MTTTRTAPRPAAPAVFVPPQTFVQLTLEEYAIAALAEGKGIILRNDVTHEAIVLEPAGRRFHIDLERIIS